MANQGRFWGCEGQGFPSVSNYDYDTNSPIRGISNTNFRFEEVAVQSVYLFKEATTSGDFESNTFIADFGITSPTTVNYISTGFLANTGSYPGWVVSGNSTVYIGTSGLFVNSGDLPSVVSSFQAHPIYGNQSIGLYKGTGANDNPTIYSVPITTGLEGPVIPGGNHQVYLQAKLNYGSTGQIKSYVRGYAAGAIVAYYDFLSSQWLSTVPTGVFNVSYSGFTEIKYDFYATSYPAATPTSFDLYISNVSTGTFITVDDIHIDAYFKKNAFVDYLVPSGYFIQMTPDLGWHNVMSMFESSDQDFVNPHLKTLGPYKTDLGNLEDNLDNSVSAIIDSEDFNNSVTNNFKKYLWRALPITPNGQIGPGGYPQKFQYIGNELDNQFSVDNVTSDDTSIVKVVSGKKSKRMKVLVDGQENHPGLTYPTDLTWRLEIHLNTSKKTISLQGIDSSGGTTAITKIALENKLYLQNSQSLWNVFDEHGLVVDLPRLKDESNYNYSLRIKDYYKNRPGSTFYGIVNGATRELNIKKVADAITLSIPTNQYNNPLSSNLDIEVTAYSLRLRTDSMNITESLFVDPVYGTIDLSYLPKELPQFVSIEGAGNVGIHLVEDETIFDDSKNLYRFKVNSEEAYGKYVTVKYSYILELLFKNYPTLESLINAINGYRDSSNRKILTASLSGLLSGNEQSLGLFITTVSITSANNYVLSWSPVFFKRISDRGYRDYYLTNSETNLKQTAYYDYVKELKDGTKIFWGAIESDRSRWDAADSKDLGMDSIPTLFDPPLSKFVSLHTGIEVSIEAINAWGRDNLGFSNELLYNFGLSHDLFQPGVAHTSDLQPGIYTTFSFIESDSSFSSNIGPTKNENTQIVFSGQR